MAKCPACLRKVSFKAVVQQAGLRKYRCIRCGRSWRFSRGSLALAVVIAVCAAILVGLGFLSKIDGTLKTWIVSLPVFALVFYLGLLWIGRLEPPGGRKSK